MDISDHDLMMAVKNGDLDKMGLLFERHHQNLYNLFLWQTRVQSLSEDMVQEVFFRMIRSRHTWRGDGKFTTWMYSIARSVRADHYRKNRRETTSLDEVKDIALNAPTPEEALENSNQSALLQNALSQLSEEKREVLILSRFQDMKYEEISKIINCSVGTIKSRVYWALRDLAEIYQQLTGEKP